MNAAAPGRKPGGSVTGIPGKLRTAPLSRNEARGRGAHGKILILVQDPSLTVCREGERDPVDVRESRRLVSQRTVISGVSFLKKDR
jgi:hypothetical protein